MTLNTKLRSDDDFDVEYISLLVILTIFAIRGQVEIFIFTVTDATYKRRPSQ